MTDRLWRTTIRSRTRLVARIGTSAAVMAGLSCFSVTLVTFAARASAGGACTSTEKVYYKAGTNLTPDPPNLLQGDISVTPSIPSGYILCSGHPNTTNWLVTSLQLQPQDPNGNAQSGTMYVYGYPCIKPRSTNRAFEGAR
jgi:hypothetical protein